MESVAKVEFEISSYNKYYILLITNIQKLLLYSIHVFFSIGHFLSILLKKISSPKLGYFLQTIQATNVIEDAQKLNKIPNHLLVVVQEDEVNLHGIADILLWSLFAGIPCITLCDKNGYLQQNCSLLQEKYHTKLQLMCKNHNVQYPVTQFHIEKCVDYCNASFNVIISSICASRHNLVSSIRSLSLEMANNDSLKQKFGEGTLDVRLKERHGICIEPDLAITCGPYLSYFGFQPWNMRLTEIISLSTHHNLSYDKFHQALKTFSRCQQRHGT